MPYSIITSTQRGRASHVLRMFGALALILGSTFPAIAAPPTVPVIGNEREVDFDWVQMKSGEWLKGTIEHMQDEKLIFDSDEFGDQTLDWGDIAGVVSKSSHTFRIEGLDPITGTFEMRDGQITINDGTQTLQVTSADILSSIIKSTLFSARLSIACCVFSA